MRRLRYSINVTLDGCCDHLAVTPDEVLHDFHRENLERADAVIYGRVTYQMMEEAWRRPDSGEWPEWMPAWMVPFAEAMDRTEKYVVSNTLETVDWNSELIRGDLTEVIGRIKAEKDEGLLYTGGLALPLVLANLGLIDEYEFMVLPVIAGHGPTLLSGLREAIALELVERRDFPSGATALLYRPAPSVEVKRGGRR